MSIPVPTDKLHKYLSGISLLALITTATLAFSYSNETMLLIIKWRYATEADHKIVSQNINKLKIMNQKIENETDVMAKNKLVDEKNFFVASTTPIDNPETKRMNDEVEYRLDLMKRLEYPFYVFSLVMIYLFYHNVSIWRKSERQSESIIKK